MTKGDCWGCEGQPQLVKRRRLRVFFFFFLFFIKYTEGTREPWLTYYSYFPKYWDINLYLFFHQQNDHTNFIIVEHCNLLCNVPIQRRPDNNSIIVLSLLFYSHLCDDRVCNMNPDLKAVLTLPKSASNFIS